MTKDDAKMFPILASVSLLSLYLAFKYFNEDVVKQLVFIYLIFVSSATLAGCFNLVLENYFPKVVYTFKLTWRIIEILNHYIALRYSTEIRLCDVISYPIAFACGILYYFNQHWVGNNILGISIVIIVPLVPSSHL